MKSQTPCSISGSAMFRSSFVNIWFNCWLIELETCNSMYVPSMVWSLNCGGECSAAAAGLDAPQVSAEQRRCVKGLWKRYHYQLLVIRLIAHYVVS